MAKRPQFNLPSTKADTAAPKSEWVYRSDEKSTSAEPPPPASTPAAVTAPVDAEAIVRSYAAYAAGAGVIPVPMFDVLAIASVQLKMLAALAERYDVPFNRDLGKSVIAALMGSGISSRLGSGLAGSLMKAIPGIGAVGGALAMPAAAYGATYAIGRVFAMHFESGGTLLTIDVSKMRERFRGELSKATS